MAKTHHFNIKKRISEDAAGVVYHAHEQPSGGKVQLRKYLHIAANDNRLDAVEEVAYQVAVDRLCSIRHPSLRQVVSGGCDPADGTPFLATRSIDAEPLQHVLKQSYLSVEMATGMLSQLLELCELLSHILAEEGVWVETDTASIAVVAEPQATRFVFWAAPLNALNGKQQPPKLSSIVTLTEAVMGWQGIEISEREGGPLFAWLKWLKQEVSNDNANIREVREMLAAAAGVEPPAPIDALIAEAQRKPGLLESLPRFSFNKLRAPKMPLFALLCLMFVIQSSVGWLWVRKINRDINKELETKLSIYHSPYTVLPEEGRENDAPERGSQPLHDLND